MRGRWIAQRLQDFVVGDNDPLYKATIVGDETGLTSSLSVGTRTSGTNSRGARGSQDYVQQLTRQLQHLGIAAADAQAIVDTLFAVYGGGYSSKSAFAQDFLKGALQGEFGVEGARGVGYYAGWMILGFIPGVDILPDLRDAFALQVTKCNGWTWDSWKCRAVAIVEDAVDVVAVVPFWGKLADTAQVAKIVYKMAKSGGSKERIWLLKNGKTILFRVLFDGRRGYWALPPLGHYGRGIQLEKVLRTSKYPGWTRLDDYTKNTPLIDFARKTIKGADVVSVKSHDLSLVTSSNKSKLTSSITKQFEKLMNKSDDELWKILYSRDVSVPKNSTYMRQLDVVVDQVPTGHAAVGVRQAVCKEVLSSRSDIPVLKVWVNTGSPADGFVEWAVSESVCRAMRPVIDPY